MEHRDDLNRPRVGLDQDPASDPSGEEQHATTGGAAAAGAVTGGLIGLAGGPAGAAAGAVGGALVAAIAERVMHTDDDSAREAIGLDDDRDKNVMFEDRDEPSSPTYVSGSAPAASASTGTPVGTGAAPAHQHQFIAGRCTCGTTDLV